MNIQPVIMAGGSGSRMWPLSRALYPKQFLALNSDRSMLQESLQRLSQLNHEAPIIICNEEHRFLAAEQLRNCSFPEKKIILEPVGRNTAPAIALAALQSVENGQDPNLLVLTADHVIKNTQAFTSAVIAAEAEASQGKVVTFGIVVDKPETGFGYIKKGQLTNIDDNSTVCEVLSFVEKPNEEDAQSYLDSGDYFWNSGMFMVKASVYLELLSKYAPEIMQVCQVAMELSSRDYDFIRPNAEEFSNCPDDSIDYAIMEPLTQNESDRAVVIPLDAGWSDVGSFSTLHEISEKDNDGNVIKGDVISTSSTNNYINSEHKLIATVGVDNLVIVSTKDAVLIANKEQVQDIKLIVNQLKESGRTEHRLAREVFRPWGKYDSIDTGKRDQVKRITVNPGQKLSIQKHFHRAEHWVVVSGTAEVTKGDTIHLVTENESIYLPVGCIHALYNPGKIPLEIIEVQTGSYLGEDDIVRLEDVYGRVNN